MNFKHKVALFIAALTLAALPIMPAAVAAAKGSHYYDFSETLKPWVSATDGNSKHTLEIRGGGPVNPFANLSARSMSDDGDGPGARQVIPWPIGVWAMANVSTYGDTLIRVHWKAESTSMCEGCQLKIYVGEAAPTRITQFTAVDDAHYLKEYWQSYSYKAEVLKPGTPPGSVYVAIGWSGSNASIGLDDITIDVMPRP